MLLTQEALLKEHGSELQLKHVRVAITQSERLMRLIEDLLDVARLQSGKFSLRREPVRLETLLEQAVASAQVLAEGQKIELIIDGGAGSAGGGDGTAAASTPAFAKEGDGDDAGDDDARNSGEPLLVNGDAARIEQAVLNLLTNAITYAPGSARIEVRLGPVDSAAPDGTTVAVAEINVQDYGKGIAAKDLSEVFTRFYQVSKGNPLPAQGGGVGAAVVARRLRPDVLAWRIRRTCPCTLSVRCVWRIQSLRYTKRHTYEPSFPYAYSHWANRHCHRYAH